MQHLHQRDRSLAETGRVIADIIGLKELDGIGLDSQALMGSPVGIARQVERRGVTLHVPRTANSSKKGKLGAFQNHLKDPVQ